MHTLANSTVNKYIFYQSIYHSNQSSELPCSLIKLAGSLIIQYEGLEKAQLVLSKIIFIVFLSSNKPESS